MVDIRTVCPTCQTKVGLEPSHIMLLAEHPDWADEERAGFYAYACSACSAVVAQWASEEAVRVLVCAGAALWSEPVSDDAAPPPERAEPSHGAPPLTADDLIDLHLVLRADDWLDRLLALDGERPKACGP